MSDPHSPRPHATDAVPQPTPDEERDAVLAERLDWEAEQEAKATAEPPASAETLETVSADYRGPILRTTAGTRIVDAWPYRCGPGDGYDRIGVGRLVEAVETEAVALAAIRSAGTPPANGTTTPIYSDDEAVAVARAATPPEPVGGREAARARLLRELLDLMERGKALEARAVLRAALQATPPTGVSDGVALDVDRLARAIQSTILTSPDEYRGPGMGAYRTHWDDLTDRQKRHVIGDAEALAAAYQRLIGEQADSAREQAGTLVTATVRTHDPSKYTLHNAEDGTVWQMTEDGWVAREQADSEEPE